MARALIKRAPVEKDRGFLCPNGTHLNGPERMPTDFTREKRKEARVNFLGIKYGVFSKIYVPILGIYGIVSYICYAIEGNREHLKQNQVMRNLEMAAVELREVLAAKSILEAREKTLRAEIVEGLETQNLTLLRVGGFTVSIRKNKTWGYSKWVRTLEKMLKTRKSNEQNNGTATYEETPTWQFLSAK